MENRALLAFIISIVIITLWTFWFAPQKKPIPKVPEQEPVQKAEEKVEIEKPATTDQVFISEQKSASDQIEQSVLVETPLYIAKLGSRGATLRSWKLKNYRESLSKDAPLIDLLDFSPENGTPLELRVNEQADAVINSANFVFDRNNIVLKNAQDNSTLISRYSSPNGVTVVKQFTFHGDRYTVDLSISLCDTNGKPVQDQLGLAWTHLMGAKASKGSRWAGYSGPVFFSKNEFKEVKDIDKYPSQGEAVQWAGFTLKYFLTAIVPLGSVENRLFLKEENNSVNMIVMQGQEDATTCLYEYELFLGPKIISELEKANFNLDKSVDFGFFDIIARPLLITLITIDKYTHNYGIAIIVLTILIKLLFWPLTHKSYASMKEMQKIQPRIKQIRERFKHDKEQMNREMMLLYKTHKVNPLGGCLPMLLQIPVFFALYKALLGSIELRHAPFIFWIRDLASPDYVFHFPPGMSLFGIEGIGPLPLLMGASMVIQQKMTPTMGDPTQAKIMMLMPVFFTFIFISFPSGLVLYWLLNNVLSIVQQVYINSKLQ
jgi:YidC/Oxa1 family membrane protein insertase